MKTTWLIAGALALAGCSEKNKDSGEARDMEPAGDKAGTAAAGKPDGAPADMDRPPPEPARLEVADFDPQMVPSGIQVKGKRLGEGLHFSDASGDNWVVFGKVVDEKKNSAYLYAKHAVARPSGIEELRDVRDKVEECEFDLHLDLVDDSLEVTDLDGDGVGEVWFAYELGCRSDMSPNTLKLLALEGGDKYILRGDTQIKDPTGAYGGTYKVDPSFKKGPKEFLEHAKTLWKKIL